MTIQLNKDGDLWLTLHHDDLASRDTMAAHVWVAMVAGAAGAAGADVGQDTAIDSVTHKAVGDLAKYFTRELAWPGSRLGYYTSDLRPDI